jgi:hypothetical protein
MDSTLLQVKSNSFSGLTGSVGSSESETLFWSSSFGSSIHISKSWIRRL